MLAMRSDSRPPLPPIKRQRHDGWTPQRQMLFLAELRRSRNVVRAAAAAGMNRKSAYRLRERADGAEFAAAWDRTLRVVVPVPRARSESHSESPTSAQRPQSPARISPRESPESPTSGQNSRHCQSCQLPRPSSANRWP
jgi:hypothetical protein